MALKADYVVRETLSNLWRNLLLTSASMLTVAVSLSLVGAALLLRQGVDNATVQWRGGIEFSIYMTTDATPDQSDAIERDLRRSPDVKDVIYVSQEEAYEEFKVLFSDSPDMVDNVSADVLPPSYRVVPAIDDADAITALGKRFEGKPGVKEVVLAEETIDTILKVARTLQFAIVMVALVLLLSAALLIFNTIRMAIFSRRREIEVMKLVGATNWFIRVPFMLEGLVQGLVGASVSFLVIWGLRTAVLDWVRDFDLFRSFIVSSSQVAGTGIFMLGVGAGIGAIGAGVAVTRFLDV